MRDIELHIGEGQEAARVINVHTEDGLSIRIRVSNGPHGLGITARPNGPLPRQPLTVTGNLRPDEELIPQVDANEVTVTQYRDNEDAQAFKAWYGSPEKEDPHAHRRPRKTGDPRPIPENLRGPDQARHGSSQLHQGPAGPVVLRVQQLRTRRAPRAQVLEGPEASPIPD